MKIAQQISDAELEVMKVLWELEQATSSQIVERLSEDTDWKPKTIQTLITRLAAKGAVAAEKTESKAYLYTPLISEDEYKSYANHSFLQKMYDGSVKMMLTTFVKEQKISKAEIESLKKLLDEEE
ncbi:BlaI/MecI/CopY family transcriptional regulator [Dethiobacter alkaliphilus]|uniref:BlaI/MecI/CopY family transcriptional regulator n=1 Tax=Dethiobacter alkaliphilus TaxID=427926 RepID=UPI00222659B8|nr:BlaI/MecI/CopY family transcriptional regulator [Dethiobacter alkaliphilus]MCW3490471.1 BlaI/MecI/CopY family transcriptional regulator [Dethiobacter alkaliphilus]